MRQLMNKKSQELELRNIMQGLEEFATFMSFKGNNTGLRIISVESVAQQILEKPDNPPADIIKMSQHSTGTHQNTKQSVSRSQAPQNRQYH